MAMSLVFPLLQINVPTQCVWPHFDVICQHTMITMIQKTKTNKQIVKKSPFQRVLLNDIFNLRIKFRAYIIYNVYKIADLNDFTKPLPLENLWVAYSIHSVKRSAKGVVIIRKPLSNLFLKKERIRGLQQPPLVDEV